mmetsp:Transcript_14251/g.44512  ORF Transcript_14251/g.44512 Transcript_14251/m.44512 type:complete len:408 (+) Transcript_14251:623-1846(+)
MLGRGLAKLLSAADVGCCSAACGTGAGSWKAAVGICGLADTKARGPPPPRTGGTRLPPPVAAATAVVPAMAMEVAHGRERNVSPCPLSTIVCGLGEVAPAGASGEPEPPVPGKGLDVKIGLCRACCSSSSKAWIRSAAATWSRATVAACSRHQASNASMRGWMIRPAAFRDSASSSSASASDLTTAVAQRRHSSTKACSVAFKSERSTRRAATSSVRLRRSDMSAVREVCSSAIAWERRRARSHSRRSEHLSTSRRTISSVWLREAAASATRAAAASAAAASNLISSWRTASTASKEARREATSCGAGAEDVGEDAAVLTAACNSTSWLHALSRRPCASWASNSRFFRSSARLSVSSEMSMRCLAMEASTWQRTASISSLSSFSQASMAAETSTMRRESSPLVCLVA